jgi:hypothetical protein
MYFSSLLRWRKSRLVRAGYCFIQLIDDVLDGDRSINEDPGTYADCIIGEMLEERFSKKTDASMLIGFVFNEAKQRPDFQAIKTNFIQLVSILKDDYLRRINHKTSSATELTEHHRKTFQLSMDITLAFLDSKVTSSDCPEIVDSLVWCSVMRDLKEDLAAGIINIPKEVFETPREKLTSNNIEAILKKEAVQTWIRKEFATQTTNMRAIEPKLPHLKDNIGRQAIKIFWKSIQSYVPKYEKQNKELLSGR